MKAHQIGLSFPTDNHQDKVVFHGLSFVLPTKGLIVITGDSGVGKTSLLSIISGQKKPTKGNVVYPKTWKKSPPVYLEDQLSLVSSWQIKDFIFNPDDHDSLNQLGFPLQSRKKRVQELSGGQKIRLMVALFFSQSSACYLLDEPTHALDEELRKKMIEFLTNQSNDHLIVVATHDLDLIAQANHELNMRSAYESNWKNNQFNAGKINIEVKKVDKGMKKHWLRKLFWLHRGHGLGLALSVASMIIHVGLLFTGFTQHSLIHQSYQYLELERLEPFLTIQEVQQTNIHQSPFQLIKSQAPDRQQLSLAISVIPDARVVTSIAEWFPASIHIQDVMFALRFVDLPYQDNQISVLWIYPDVILPTFFELTSIKLIEPFPSFTYGQNLTIIEKRPIQSWFEPPQILLSYWQWFHLLQSKTATVNGEEKSFLNIFQTMHPPSSALVHDPSGTVKDILTTHPKNHPWTLHQSLEKTYELKHLLLDSTRTLNQCIFLGLMILGLFVWSTRLHWIYQNHQAQWQWLLLLHLSMRRIWTAISLRTFLSGFMTLGVVQLMFIFLMNHSRLIPGSTLMTMIMIGLLIYLIQQISRYLILRWYGDARRN
jgi:ABC-type lipoprotein export system ATPase subunit